MIFHDTYVRLTRKQNTMNNTIEISKRLFTELEM